VTRNSRRPQHGHHSREGLEEGWGMGVAGKTEF
jgi:hypothetical protein